jgi:HAMP domain-containing protein
MSNLPIITKDDEIRALRKQVEKLRKQLELALDEMVRMQDGKRRAN